MTPKTEKLRKLMAAHKLRARDVADMVGVVTAQTVRVWASTSQTGQVRDIPDFKLELLELKLNQRSARQ